MAQYHQQALELVRNNDWEGAHTLIQDYSDDLACVVHGYLHRMEGDLGNARYWYGRAGETMPDNSLEKEYSRISDQV
ncbi:MAG: hypothetical protein CMQ05_03745 [Gammaproteobacteria bacterium]|nr:hypothetical protein [Gammaproteobacteria bacterium]RPG23971.1 MAG: hypothetical protein CBC10_012765 [Gammaproteobacteria bacterium TMED50]|tara:strand:+ start:9321 stop:9551 length:231 start_codon:yes stop_codon:yes gene_type:complete